MSTWATHRKLSYIGAFFVLVFLGLALPTFFTVYEPPTCSDSKQNQGEAGVDCGGPCSILCQAQSLKPIILWQRAFKVTRGVYNAVAYVENPNLNSSAKDVPYVFKFYDDKGSLIYEREGKADIDANRFFPIFEDHIQTDEKTPFRVTFEFTRGPVFIIDKTEPLDVRVENPTLVEGADSSKVQGTLQNKSITPLYKVEVVALVFDANDNAVAASRTFVDKLDKNGSEDLVFTWPGSINFGESVCEKPADVMLVVDRSGSMDDDGLNPPEPLTSVKSAAVSFVGSLKALDQAGVVSFATDVRNPIDETLTSDFTAVGDILSRIEIATDTPQNTNIGEGIVKAEEELLSSRHHEASKSVIILLTDGIPSHPQSEDPNYPKTYAQEAAKSAKDKNIGLYVIGLGKNVDAEFLKTLVSAPESYFAAPTASDLTKIYSSIATEICKKGPAKIQIIPLVR